MAKLAIESRASDKAVVRSRVASFVRVGGGKVLVYPEPMGMGVPIDEEELALLQQCSESAPLDHHIEKIARDGTLRRKFFRTRSRSRLLGPTGLLAAGRPDIRRFLLHMSSLGLIAWEQDLHAAAGNPAREAARVDVLSVLTSNRPQSLFNCLASYLTNMQQYGRMTEIVVVDDSSTGSMEDANRLVVESAQKEFGCSIRHITMQERIRLAAEWAREAGIDSALALIGVRGDGTQPCCIGGARNTVLLACAGLCLLNSDDDVLCQPRSYFETHAGLRIEAAADPREYSFFPSHEKALKSTSIQECDLLGEHESLLGKGWSCINAAQRGFDRLDIGAARGGLLDHLQRDRGSVLVTMNGIVGDSGMESPIPLLLLEGPSFQNLVATKQSYQMATHSRAVTHTVRVKTMTASNYCMSMIHGVDNRSLIPPFMPVGRAQDNLFGGLIRAIYPEHFTGFLPVTLPHLPPEETRYAAGATQVRRSLQLDHIIGAAVEASAAGLPRSSAEPRMRLIGAALREMGGCRETDFLFQLHSLLVAQTIRLMDVLERRLDETGSKPEYWADDMRCQLDDARRSINAGRPLSAEEASVLVRPGKDVRRLQRIFTQFGELIENWPQLWHAAARIRTKIGSVAA